MPALDKLTAIAERRLVALADILSVPDAAFTLDPRSGHGLRAGYVLSLRPDCERHIGGRVSPDDLRQYAYDHAREWLDPRHIFSGWRDPRSGWAYLEVSTVFYDRTEALRVAHRNGQVGVIDVARGVMLSVQT